MNKYFLVEDLPDQVKVVYFKNEDKNMNVLSEPVLKEARGLTETWGADKSIQGLVFISGREDQFIAGADIEDIEKFNSAEEAEHGAGAMQDIFTQFSHLPFPTVAAINGVCLGGGLELALACTWRIASDHPKTKLGLPEIQLGLIPGAGGTQRLPRLIGIQAALDLILTAKRIDPKKALKLGLVDAVVPSSQLLEYARQYSTKKRGEPSFIGHFATSTLAHDLPRWALDGNPLGRKIMEKKAKDMVDKTTKGFYPAPYKALSAVFDGIDKKLDKALALERKFFGQLATTRESHSLIHLFKATTHIKKHPYAASGLQLFKDRALQNIGVIGAGFMGAGIATLAADKELKVKLSDPNQDAISRLLKHAKQFFDKKVERRRLKSFEAESRMAYISPGLKPIGFHRLDIVIEAVFEDLALKQNILKALEGSNIHETWIFASNTSAIPIKNIAAAAKHPERVLGMHFFSPVEKMPLLEIVITEKTAPWATARAFELGQILGKQVIIVKDSPGFYTTRALAFFLNEAALILSEGTPIDKIDTALTQFGFPVGPINLIDEVGIDVGSHVLDTMAQAFSSRLVVPEGLKAVKDSGRLGRKNQKGFYLYKDGKKAGPDPAIYQLIGSHKADEIPSDEVTDRCLLLFINESIRCLEEGILAHAYDGDVGAVFGLGFPPFWGGPFKYVDHLGALTIVERLNSLADKYGQRFKPCNLLEQHARSHLKFFPNEK